MKILVDGNSHVMADPHHRTKGIGAQTQVGILAHVLKALPFFLHRIVAGTNAIDLNILALHFYGLPFALAFHKHTRGTDACPRGNRLQQLGIKLLRLHYNLYILNGRAVVKGDEIHHLTRAMGAHPSLYRYLFPKVGATKRIHYFRSLHFQ